MTREEAIEILRHRLRKKRQDLGMTQLELAIETDLGDTSNKQVHRLECGIKHLPGPDVWSAVTEALGLDRIDLLVEMGYLSTSDLGQTESSDASP